MYPFEILSEEKKRLELFVDKRPRMEKKMKVSKIKKGSKFSRHSFGTVTNLDSSRVELRNEAGYTWHVTNDVIENEFEFSDIENEIKKITATEMAQLIVDNPFIVMTVNFNKKIDEKALEAKILDLYPNKGGKILSESVFKAKVKESLSNLTKGEERTLVGYHKSRIDVNGRFAFTDMEIESGEKHNLRLVDPRALNWVVVMGVKYVLK